MQVWRLVTAVCLTPIPTLPQVAAARSERDSEVKSMAQRLEGALAACAQRCVCVYVCVCVSMRACVRACMCLCVGTCSLAHSVPLRL